MTSGQPTTAQETATAEEEAEVGTRLESDASHTAEQSPHRRKPARRGQGGQLRSEIIEAASQMLAETGDVNSLSLRSVARTVGVAATSIYLHFSDIGELIAAVKQRRFQQFTEALSSAATAAGDDPLERVKAMSRAYVAYGLSHEGNYRVMFTPLSQPDSSRQERRAIGEGAFALLCDAVADAVGQADGERVAIHLWTALHGAVTLHSLSYFPWPPVEEHVDSLVSLLLRPGTTE
ncbi:TetR/AcrR family transcriptional regulator [Streptomyces durmitorensis]|uniref:TetR/AcrR family transcriptional regulator n=1 Tax=Streptomyces durmitorensis TaxID=319947 RepID=A0ABY4PQQ3_9ACTN|nr:TetR/AcrR family transcriptional regulator [Streptomyces durmitorensis]UQT55450.1 TetR/AcrR family transcriptional regulator [Streptomyces durmitorensis]